MDPSAASVKKERKKRFCWQHNDDLMLLRQVCHDFPPGAPFGKIKLAWENIASTLMEATKSSERPVDVKGPGCVSRYTSMMEEYKLSLSKHKKETGIVEYDDNTNTVTKMKKNVF